MGKLKKVLLLVLALCVMISIMSIAAAATGAETQKTIYVNATIKDGYTGVKLMKYRDYVNDISLTPVPGKANTYSAVVTAGERYNFYYTKSGGSESPGTFTVPTDNRDLLLVRPNPNGFTTDYLWHVYGQEYTDIGTVVGGKNKYVSSFPDLIYKGESVGSGNTNILRAILSDDSNVAVGSNSGDNYGSSVSFESNVGSTTMYCVVKDGNTFVNAKFTARMGYTVTFNRNGKGSWANEPAPQYIIPGSKATSPSMTANGFTLAGWFKETGCTNEWDFDNDTVTEDITLYAKWVPNVAQIGSTTYTSLADAIAAVKTAASSERTTITLLADTNEVPVIDFTYPVQINGQGHKLGLGGASAGYAMRITAVGADVIIDNTVVGSMSVGRGINVNASGVKLVVQNNSEVYGSSYPINVYANQSGITVDNNHITITNSTIKGYCALNLWGANGVVDVTGSTLWGENNASYSPNNNEFGAIALEGLSNTTGATGYTVNVTNTTIKVTSTKGNEQYPVVFNPNSSNNTVYLTSCTIDRENATLYPLVHDEGISGNKTYVKGTTDSTTSATPVLPSGYNYCEAADGYKLVGTAVAKIGEATYYASLADAIAAVPTNGTQTTITMLADETIVGNAGFEIPANKIIVIDLNGHTISNQVNQDTHSQVIKNYGTLTIRDTSAGANGMIKNAVQEGAHAGEWWSTPQYNYITNVITNQGTLTIESGKLYQTAEGTISFAIDNLTNGGAYTPIAYINGGTIQSAKTAVRLGCNSTTKASTVVMNGGAVISGRHAFYFQSFNNKKNLGSLTINDGVISGEVSALNIDCPSDGSGFTIDVRGGKFTGSLIVDGTVPGFISGGKFSVVPDAQYIVSGYVAMSNTDDDAATYPYKVGVAPVAQIGSTTYASLADAIAAVPTDGTKTTITMLADSVESGTITIASTKNIVLDLNGHTVSHTSTLKSVYFITNNGTLEITDLSVGENGKITMAAVPDTGYSVENVTLYNCGGTLTLTKGTIENTTAGGLTYAVNNSSNAWGSSVISTFNMTGGVLSAPNGDATLRVYQNTGVSWKVYSTNHVNISGGTILDNAIFVDTVLYTNGQDVTDFNNNDITKGCVIDTEINITGGTINGLIDMKIRHPFGTSLNISGGDFTNAKLWVRKYANEYGKNLSAGTLSEPTTPMVNISGGTWSFVTGMAFGLSYDCGATSWTSYEQPYCVTGGVFNVDLNNYSGIKFESGETGVANSGANKATYPYTVGVAVAKIGTKGYETLQAAIDAAQTGDTVTLYRDVTGSFTIGKSITLTSVNGAKITGSGTSAISINASGVAVTLNGITIAKGATRGVCIDSNAANVTLVINNSSIAAGSYALDTRPGADYATVTVSGTTLDGWAAMNIWGDHGAFNISGSTLNGANTTTQSSSNDFAVIALEADTAARTSGELMGAYADGNTITLTGCTIGATTSSANSQAIIVYNAYGEDTNPSQTKAAEYLGSGKHAKNNTVIFDGCDYVSTTTGGLVYDGASKLAGGDGTTIYAANNNSFIVKTSGTYTIDPTTYLASGFEAVNNGNGTWTVDKIKVAQIGDVKYETLQAAIDAAQSGDTIKLLADVTYGTDHVVDVWEKEFNLDLNSHTFTTNSNQSITASNNGYKASALCWSLGSAGSKPITITNGTIRTAYGAGIYVDDPAIVATLSGLTINANTVGVQTTAEYSTAIRLTTNANIVVVSGSYEGKYAIVVSNSGGIVTINGGTFKGDIFFSGSTNKEATKSITINGGNFDGTFVNTDKGTLVIKGGYFTVDPTAYVADGYAVENGAYEIGDVTYKYKVGVAPVAQIGTTKYASLADAIDAANAAESSVTITLLENCETGSTYSISNPLVLTKAGSTLDLNGKTITVTNNFSFVICGNDITVENGSLVSGVNNGKATKINSYILVVNDCNRVNLTDLTMMGGLSIGGSQDDWGTVGAPKSGIAYTHGAGTATNVTITNCNITSGDYYAVCSQMNSTATIVSGTYIANTGSAGSKVIHGFFTGTDGPEGKIRVKGGQFNGTIDSSNAGWVTLEGGVYTLSPAAGLLASHYVVADNSDATYLYKVVEQYVEQSTTNTTTTTTTTDEQSGTTTTTTTTTNLATAENGQDTQYVIKVETTTVTTPTDNPNNSTEQTNTVYKPVNVGVTSNNNVDEHVEVTAENLNASAGTIEGAKDTVEEAVTGSTATAEFKAKLDGNSGTSSANVLKTTAAANAIAKAAATVDAGKTGDITDAKVILQTTLKSYTLADGTNSSVKATKVVYDIKPVAVIYKVEGNKVEQLVEAVELDNADIKEGESFTITIPVPANMATENQIVKVSHIGTNGYSTEIGTYHVDGTGNNRYVTVTVDHFSEFELEEAAVSITGSCDISAAISLSDSIDINFYVKNLASGTNLSDYKVVYSFNGGESKTYIGNEWTYDGNGKYKFTVASCAARQMNDTVTFEVLYNPNGSGNDEDYVSIKKVESYSIRQYCLNKINANSDQKLVDICRAVLDYGAEAQKYFGYKTNELANRENYGLTSKETIVSDTYKIAVASKADDITKLSASLNTVSKTEINFYVTTASNTFSAQVTLNGNPVSNVVISDGSDGVYKITVKGIAARNLDNVYVLTVETKAGTTTLTYSALAYTYRKQDSSLSESGLSLAIYNYYLKAKAYFG